METVFDEHTDSYCAALHLEAEPRTRSGVSYRTNVLSGPGAPAHLGLHAASTRQVHRYCYDNTLLVFFVEIHLWCSWWPLLGVRDGNDQGCMTRHACTLAVWTLCWPAVVLQQMNTSQFHSRMSAHCDGRAVAPELAALLGRCACAYAAGLLLPTATKQLQHCGDLRFGGKGRHLDSLLHTVQRLFFSQTHI
jgi:hypothetical protein